MGDNQQSGEPKKQKDQLAKRAGNSSEMLVDHADLTALTLVDLLVENASAKQALFANTLFRGCKFVKCNFSRSDFEGAIFQSCNFKECDFSIADFRSIDAVRTHFTDCTFSDGSIRSSHFSECSLENCRLEGHSFGENHLENSTLSRCSFLRSTLLQCNFFRTDFQHTDLSDCTSQYHLFKECTFKSATLNAEAIGLTFGLTRENLISVGLVWRGIGIDKVDGTSDLAADLVTTYGERGWSFSAAIVKLNFRLAGTTTAFNEIFSAIKSSVKSSLPLKVDEIRFLGRVIERLCGDGRLPFAVIVQGLETVIGCAELRSPRDADILKPLYHALKDAEYSELNAIERVMAPLQDIDADKLLTVAFVFSDEPPLSLRRWLAQLHADGVLTGAAPRFARALRGSYIELFYLSVGTLGSILICLSMVAQIVDKLIDIRARSAVLFGSNLPAVIRRRALHPAAAPSQAVIREFQKYLQLASGSKAEQFFSAGQELTDRLMRIEIRDTDNALSNEHPVQAG